MSGTAGTALRLRCPASSASTAAWSWKTKYYPRYARLIEEGEAVKYSREAAFLRDQMGPEVIALLSSSGGFVAGGAVTSAFSSARVNDFDLFFPTTQQLHDAISRLTLDDKSIDTDAALSVILGGHRVQLVKVLTRTPAEVISSFDFTVCQAAFDLDDGFIFGEDFFRHLAQRRLVFNINAQYPICSLYRARKFIKRGFSLSGIEAIKLGLCIHSLEINTYADLRKQLMGIDTLFLKDLTDSLKGQDEKQYNLNEFLDTLNMWLEKLDAITGEGEDHGNPS
jgi:hypothetical protein